MVSPSVSSSSMHLPFTTHRCQACSHLVTNAPTNPSARSAHLRSTRASCWSRSHLSLLRPWLPYPAHPTAPSPYHFMASTASITIWNYINFFVYSSHLSLLTRTYTPWQQSLILFTLEFSVARTEPSIYQAFHKHFSRFFFFFFKGWKTS